MHRVLSTEFHGCYRQLLLGKIIFVLVTYVKYNGLVCSDTTSSIIICNLHKMY